MSNGLSRLVATVALVMLPRLALSQTEPQAVAAGDTASVRNDSLAGETRPKASALSVDAGSVRFSGVLQAWYASGTEDGTSTFRVRRAEMRFTGTVTPTTTWTVMVDPAKSMRVVNGTVNQATLMLQDAFITSHWRRISFDLGQMRLPTTFEGGTLGAAGIETYDRSMLITEGKLGLVRDLGAMVTVPATHFATFKLGAFNGVGESQNSPDTNNAKVIAGRLDLEARTIGLHVGGSGATSGHASTTNPRRDRIGGDIQWRRGPVTLRSEWMHATDDATPGEGWYALAAYRVGALELASRYDVWDRDTRADSDVDNFAERDVVAGANWLLSGTNVKLQMDYVHRSVGAETRHLLYLAMLTSW